MASPVDGVLLIAFGGPTRPDEIRPFLANVAHGRAIPPARLEEVAHHYERIGGRPPLNELPRPLARSSAVHRSSSRPGHNGAAPRARFATSDSASPLHRPQCARGDGRRFTVRWADRSGFASGRRTPWSPSLVHRLPESQRQSS